MSSWSCPHHEASADACRRLGGPCVLGRKGCVLPRKLRFAVSPEEQLEARMRREGSPRPPGRKR